MQALQNRLFLLQFPEDRGNPPFQHIPEKNQQARHEQGQAQQFLAFALSFTFEQGRQRQAQGEITKLLAILFNRLLMLQHPVSRIGFLP